MTSSWNYSTIQMSSRKHGNLVTSTALSTFVKLTAPWNTKLFMSLQWPHNGCNGVSNHWRLDCFLNRLSRRRSKKISQLRVNQCQLQCSKWGQFAIPETCKIGHGLANNYVYYAHQTGTIYQVLPYSVDFKVPRGSEIHWVRHYLVNVVLFGIRTCKRLKWP